MPETLLAVATAIFFAAMMLLTGSECGSKTPTAATWIGVPSLLIMVALSMVVIVEKLLDWIASRWSRIRAWG